MESYVVRIYRREKRGPEKILGTVELPGEVHKVAFTNRDELWNSLTLHAFKSESADRKILRKK